MVHLETLPSKDNLSVLKLFYKRNSPENSSPLVTKLRIHDCVIPVSTVVLSWWSKKFQDIRDENGQIYLEGFDGHSEQVKDCLDLLHGHQVDISFENAQVILKFGILFEIRELIKEVENWLQDRIKDSSDTRETRSSKRRKRSGRSGDEIRSCFIKILKIGIHIDNVKHEYDFIFELCAKEYELFPDIYLSLLVEEFKSVPKTLVRFLFRKYKTFEHSLRFLKMVPKSEENVRVILEMLDELISGYDICVTSGSEIASLLAYLAEGHLSPDIVKTLGNVHTTLDETRLTSNNQAVINQLVKDKPWRKIQSVSELVKYGESVPSISKYMNLEIIIDWLKFDKNHEKISESDKNALLNYIQNMIMSKIYMEHKCLNVFYRYLRVDVSQYIKDKTPKEYFETELSYWHWDVKPTDRFSKLDFSNKWLYLDNDADGVGKWCKESQRKVNKGNLSKRINVSFVPDVTGNKSTQLQLKVNSVDDAHVHQQCRYPAPVFLRWSIEVMRSSYCYHDYMSSEVSTYQEIEEFVREHPYCTVKVNLVHTV